MKKNKNRIILLICVFLLFSASFQPIYGQNDIEVYAGNALRSLGVMHGDSKGNLNLQNKITRSEFTALVIRMMGYDKEAHLDDIALKFDDTHEIQPWAEQYIKIALKYKLIKGYNDNTVRPNAFVSSAEAQTMILRALGYGNSIDGGAWPESVINKSESLGLAKNISTPASHQLTRGETAVLIYNSLTIPFN